VGGTGSQSREASTVRRRQRETLRFQKRGFVLPDGTFKTLREKVRKVKEGQNSSSPHHRKTLLMF
jgi:hypothetical protein